MGAAFALQTYRHPKGYVRVSTDEQAEEGTSIETQVRQLISFAAAFNVVLTESDIYLDEGWSGKDMARPAMQRLRADAKAGLVDCVLVTKLDRFSRNLRDTVNLCLGEWQDEAPPDHRVILKSITEPFDTHTDFGRMVFGLLAMFAEFERRRIADRTWAGKTSRAEAGRNPGQRPPYGFSLTPAPDGRGSCFEVVPAEAAMIRTVAHLYIEGLGYDAIASRLNEQGHRYRGGALWQTQQIARLLSNPIITGVFAYGRTAAQPDGSVRRVPRSDWVFSAEPLGLSAIISSEMFEQIQRLRAQRQVGGRARSGGHVLTGILRCGRCGSACGTKHAGPGGEYHYYRCLRRKQSGVTACDQPTLRADYLDAQVLSAIEAVLRSAVADLSTRVAAQTNAKLTGMRTALSEADAEANRLSETRSRYFAWLEQGQMRPDAVQERLDQIDTAISSLRRKRDGIETELTELTESSGCDDIPPFQSAWRHLNPSEQKRLIGALITQVRMDGRRICVHWAFEEPVIGFTPKSPLPGFQIARSPVARALLSPVGVDKIEPIFNEKGEQDVTQTDPC